LSDKPLIEQSCFKYVSAFYISFDDLSSKHTTKRQHWTIFLSKTEKQLQNKEYKFTAIKITGIETISNYKILTRYYIKPSIFKTFNEIVSNNK